MRSSVRTLIATASVAVIATGAFVLVRAQSRPTKAAVAETASNIPSGTALLVDAVPVQKRSARPENVLSGQVEPYRVATVAAEVSDRVVTRAIEAGDRIGQGGTLIVLDSAAASAALDQAQASLAQATAARRQAESDYTRAVVETDAARQQAKAQVALASAGEQKARSFTRAQELRQAQAALAQAQTDEHLAKIEFDRYSWLVKQGAAAQQTLDHAQATLEAATARRVSAEQGVSLAQEGARQEDIAAATAQVDTARANLRIADTRDTRLASIRKQIEGLRAQEGQASAAVRQARIALSKRRIVAPFTGRVLATSTEVGEMLSPGTPVARLGEIARVKVTFAVPEASRPMLHLGQSVTITADAVPGSAFSGKITNLGFQADPRTRAFPLEVTVNNTNEKLLPNMVTRLRLPVGATTERLFVPADAVATDAATPYVFVLKNGEANRHDVTLGAPSGSQVEIVHGLTPGEKIAATPQRLTDGATVRLAAQGARP